MKWEDIPLDTQNLILDLRRAAEIIQKAEKKSGKLGRFIAALNDHADRIEKNAIYEAQDW
jgi:hypothetical protein